MNFQPFDLAQALGLYRSLGFAEAPYPERSPLHEGILFMVRTTIG